MKKVLFILFIILSITACSNKVVDVEVDEKVEENKIAYLELKNKLVKHEEFNKIEDIPCELSASVDRVSDEEISYRIILDKPKENLYDVEAILVHNQFSEDIFPSIGIFDDKTKLIVDNEDVKGIELVGYIESTKDIKDLNLELRLWMKYKDEDGKEHEIYYKVDNINYHDNSTNNDEKK